MIIIKEPKDKDSGLDPSNTNIELANANTNIVYIKQNRFLYFLLFI